MNTFFHEETGSNQFNLTYTFDNTAVPDPGMCPVIFVLSYFSGSADTVNLFLQDPGGDAQHRLALRDDTVSGNTTQQLSFTCGREGRIVVPRGAAAPADGSTQISDGEPWELRLVTTNKTADAFISFMWSWQRIG